MATAQSRHNLLAFGFIAPITIMLIMSLCYRARLASTGEFRGEGALRKEGECEVYVVRDISLNQNLVQVKL